VKGGCDTVWDISKSFMMLLTRSFLVVGLSLILLQMSQGRDMRRRKRDVVEANLGPAPMDLMGYSGGEQSFLDLQSLVNPVSVPQSLPDGMSQGSPAAAMPSYETPPQPTVPDHLQRPGRPGRVRLERPDDRPRHKLQDGVEGRGGAHDVGYEVPDGYTTQDEYKLAQGSSWANSPSKSHKWATPEESGDGYFQPEPQYEPEPQSQPQIKQEKKGLWALPSNHPHKWTMKGSENAEQAKPTDLVSLTNSGSDKKSGLTGSWSAQMQNALMRMSQMGQNPFAGMRHKWVNNHMASGVSRVNPMQGTQMPNFMKGMQTKGRPNPMMNAMQMQGNRMNMVRPGQMKGMPGGNPNMQIPHMNRMQMLPGMQRPRPGMQIPGMPRPGMQIPGVQRPGMQISGMQRPVMQISGMQRPGMQISGMQANKNRPNLMNPMLGNAAMPQRPGPMNAMHMAGNAANPHRPGPMGPMHMLSNAANGPNQMKGLPDYQQRHPGPVRGPQPPGSKNRFAMHMANAMRQRPGAPPMGMPGSPNANMMYDQRGSGIPMQNR